MFCVKCGKEIPNGNDTCMNCGHKVGEPISVENAVFETEDGETTFCVSANPPKSTSTAEIANNRSKLLLWSGAGLLSLIIMFMNYASVSVKLTYTSSDSAFSGYGLIECMDGTLGTAARMMVLLIIVNIAMIITGIVRYKTDQYNKYMTPIMFVESILSVLASFISFININTEMSEFDSSLSSAYVGVGAYLNLILSIAIVILAIYIKKKFTVGGNEK